MRALLQRVKGASVAVDGEAVGEIGPGMLVFFCAEAGDDKAGTDFFARKIAGMRIFADAEGRLNRSVGDAGGAVLVVSQFTLAATWRKGNRPSLSGAADPALGERLYDHFCGQLAKHGVPVKTGRFGAHMEVSLINDGPVTIWMNSADP
jgi:D-tyrosyl-tRNA(Tyr) deacylase